MPFEKINIQIKSKNSTKEYNKDKKAIKYSIKKTDLENYKRAIGMIFFLCISADDYNYKNDKIKIYYKVLFPFDIDKLLHTISNKKTKSISISLDYLDMTNENAFYELLKTCADDKTRIRENSMKDYIKLSEIKKYNLLSANGTFHIDKNNNLIPNKENFGYATDKFGRKLIIENDCKNFSSMQNVDIMIDNQVFYENSVLISNLEKNTWKINLSESLHISNKELNFEIVENESLIKILHDLEFLIKLKKTKNIQIQNTNISINKNYKIENFKNLKNHIVKIFNKCNELGIDKTILQYKYINADTNCLNKLYNTKLILDYVYLIELSNKIYPYIYTNNKLSYLLDNYECKIIDENNESFTIPMLAYFIDINVFCKLNITQKILEQNLLILIQKNVCIDETFEYINSFLLNLIYMYDKTKNKMFINSAKYISETIRDKSLDNQHKLINKINFYQILIRQNIYLEKYDLAYLKNFMDSNIEYIYKFYIAILLKNKQKAINFKCLLSSKSFNDFKRMPIFYLYKNMFKKE